MAFLIGHGRADTQLIEDRTKIITASFDLSEKVSKLVLG
jgi:hypothetical protein